MHTGVEAEYWAKGAEVLSLNPVPDVCPCAFSELRDNSKIFIWFGASALSNPKGAEFIQPSYLIREWIWNFLFVTWIPPPLCVKYLFLIYLVFFFCLFVLLSVTTCLTFTLKYINVQSLTEHSNVPSLLGMSLLRWYFKFLNFMPDTTASKGSKWLPWHSKIELWMPPAECHRLQS